MKNLRYTYLTPRTVARAIINFDQGIPAVPFQFQLRTAAQVRIAGNRTINPPKTKPKPKAKRVRLHHNTTVIGGDSVPQMSTRREFGARLFVR